MLFYRVNYRKVRFEEFLRLCHPQTVTGTLSWLPIKLGLVQWPVLIVPRPDSLADLLVGECDLPAPARTAILPSVAEATSLGFVDPVYELTQTQGQPVTGVCARCRHQDRRCIIQCAYSFADSAHAAEQHVISFFEDGSTLATSNGRPKFDRHPAVEASYHPGRPIADLLDIHREFLTRRSAPPLLIGSRAELIRRVDAMSDRFFEFMSARGIFEPDPETSQ